MLALALVGHPVEHSLSPALHRAALSFCGIAGDYELLDVTPDELGSLGELIAQRRVNGFNVTVPHKEAVFAQFLESGADLSTEARAIGAVNTVLVDSQGALHGHNTDTGGFRMALEPLGKSIKNGPAVVLGAGGAARACAVGLVAAGFDEVFIAARDAGKGERLAGALGEATGKTMRPVDIFSGWQAWRPTLLVNCTPAGLNEDQVPDWLCINDLSRDTFLFDTVYRKGSVSPLVNAFVASGRRGCDGREMLVGQALLAFHFWTGWRVPGEVMRGAIKDL